MYAKYGRLHHMTQYVVIIIMIIIILGIMVSGLSNVLQRGFGPSNSFSGARNYARSAVASWTSLYLYDTYFFSMFDES